jgi:hypothetical protein
MRAHHRQMICDSLKHLAFLEEQLGEWDCYRRFPACRIAARPRFWPRPVRTSSSSRRLGISVRGRECARGTTTAREKIKQPHHGRQPVAAQCADGMRLGGGSPEELLYPGEVLAHREQVGRQEGPCRDCRRAPVDSVGVSSIANPSTVSRPHGAPHRRAAEGTPDPAPHPPAGQAGHRGSALRAYPLPGPAGRGPSGKLSRLRVGSSIESFFATQPTNPGPPSPQSCLHADQVGSEDPGALAVGASPWAPCLDGCLRDALGKYTCATASSRERRLILKGITGHYHGLIMARTRGDVSDRQAQA